MENAKEKPHTDFFLPFLDLVAARKDLVEIFPGATLLPIPDATLIAIRLSSAITFASFVEQVNGCKSVVGNKASPADRSVFEP